MFNTAFDIEQKTEFYDITPGDVYGYGVGLKVISPAGPLEFIVSRGDKHFGPNNEQQMVYYFLLGSTIDRFLFQ